MMDVLQAVSQVQQIQKKKTDLENKFGFGFS